MADLRMEGKTDVPDRFRNFSLLVFKPQQRFTVEEFWVHFARTIDLQPRHEDIVAVCT